MERRTFLKNIFGAAIVTAMPAIVVKEIEKFAPPESLTSPIISPPIEVEWADKVCYLFDDQGLIGGSTMFHMEMKRPFIDVSHDMGYREYISGPWEWNIAVERMRWIDHKRGLDYFYENKPFKIAMKEGEYKLFGEVYLTECALTCPQYDEIEEDIVLQGTGALIFETKVDANERLKELFGETEREKISGALERELFAGGHKTKPKGLNEARIGKGNHPRSRN
jgi:hypothetical protein